MSKHAKPTPTASQVSRPRAATIRTILAALVGALPLIPEIVRMYGWDSVPWIAAVAAVAAATTRVLALPAVEAYLEKYAPWLSAGGSTKEDTDGY